jgi:flagellar biosynthetic protein FliQ
MSEGDIAGILRDGLFVLLKLGGPLMLVALAVGLAVALLQAITQINEATLVFVPKLLALAVALMLLGPFMYGALSGYMRFLFDRMVAVGAS